MYPATMTRDSRTVRRCRLRVRTGAAVHRLASNVEEALRLCRLPGEEEGRVYYFRYLRFSGLPANGDRRVWLDKFQSVLLAEANRAVHGSASGALDAKAIYFHDEVEACTTLLSRIARRDRAGEWFWPQVSGSAPAAGPAAQVADTIEKLSRSEASWLAVAEVLFAFEDPTPLLYTVTATRAREWLQELQSESFIHVAASPAKLPARTARILGHVLTVFKEEDPQVLWLAALAVISVAPSEIESGRAVSMARATLLELRRVKQVTRPDIQSRTSRSEHVDESLMPVTPQNGRRESPLHDSNASSIPLLAPPAVAATMRPPETTTQQDEWRSQPTDAAGLYFLLNALNHLHLLDRRCRPRLLAHFFQQVAQLTDIDPDDPILLWTQLTLAEAEPLPVDYRMLDNWLRKIQRWCWKNGTITLGEMVGRPGRVTLTRTHLDIALSFDQIDVRIRHLGLDLDPGWLPEFGRVVHFHYHRGAIHD